MAHSDNEMARVEIARERLGLTRQSLAAAVGISTTAMDAWVTGIPSGWCVRIASTLDVSVDWISTGQHPPPWYWKSVMMTGRGTVDWAALSPSDVLTTWWETIEGALLDRFAKVTCRLIFPERVRLPRWRFTLSRNVAPVDHRQVDVTLLMQLTPSEHEKLAGELGVWPKDKILARVIREGLPATPYTLTGKSSDDPTHWRGTLRKIAAGVRGYRASRADQKRRVEHQCRVWNLLTNQQGDEPLVSGQAIVPVLSACVRAAYATESLSAMRSDLESAVEMALLTEFRGRSFLIHDMGRYLAQRRGLRLIGRSPLKSPKGLRKKAEADAISEDTLLRIFTKLKERGLPLKLGGSDGKGTDAGRTWYMGIPPASTEPMRLPDCLK